MRRVTTAVPLYTVVTSCGGEDRNGPSRHHLILLEGVPVNCSVAGSDRATVSVQAGTTAVLSLRVSCVAPFGNIRGQHLDNWC